MYLSKNEQRKKETFMIVVILLRNIAECNLNEVHH